MKASDHCLMLGLTFIVLFSLSACGTSEKSSEEVAMAKREVVAMTNLKIVAREGSKAATEVNNAQQIETVHKAWEDRERLYDKRMPLFKQELHFELNGQPQIWRVTKSGYLMQNGSSELYKMDTSSFEEHLQ